MGDKTLKHVAAFTFYLMLSAMVFSLIATYKSGEIKESSALDKVKPTFYTKAKDSEGYMAAATRIKSDIGNKYILIKDIGDNSAYTIQEDYINRKIILTLKYLKDKSLNASNIVRVNNGQVFGGPLSEETEEKGEYLIPEVLDAEGDISDYGQLPPTLDADPVKNCIIKYENSDNMTYSAEIQFTLDYLYAPIIYEEDSQIYIALKKPAEVYDDIVVLDAGHGGKDPGAESKDGSCYEKEINLNILLYLKEILDKENIKVYYTRTEDDTVFLNPRVNLANEAEADLFMSIHCNSSESSQPRGVEVLYKSDWNQGDFSSESLARIALEKLQGVTGYVNRGLVAGDEMVIINKSKVPVALIEVGFLSNQEELAFLKSDTKERQVAQTVAEIIKKALAEKHEVEN